jgi:carbon storage regulator
VLVLSRKKDEKIIIGDNITVMIIEIRGDKVRIGVEAPKDITVHRWEVYQAIKEQQAFENSKNLETLVNDAAKRLKSLDKDEDAGESVATGM